MENDDFKKDLESFCQKAKDNPSAQNLQEAFFDIMKKYHPDKNPTEQNELYDKYTKIINSVYEELKSKTATTSTEQTGKQNRTYTDYFGNKKSFDDYYDYLFHYGIDCYNAAHHIKSFTKNYDEALKYYEKSIASFKKLIKENPNYQNIDFTREKLGNANLEKFFLEGKTGR